jgi:NADH-quinone oxidoreductase subunit C
VYEPVQLTQDYRNFDYLSPWEGMTTVQLPGDEKATKPSVGWIDKRQDKAS